MLEIQLKIILYIRTRIRDRPESQIKGFSRYSHDYGGENYIENHMSEM